MDAIIQMLPPSLRRWSTYIDFPAQHQAERIFQVIVVAFSVIGFFVGYFLQELWITFAILGVGFVLANVIVVPPWPCFRRHPIKWLPEYGDDKHEKKTEEPKEQKKEGKKRQKMASKRALALSLRSGAIRGFSRRIATCSTVGNHNGSLLSLKVQSLPQIDNRRYFATNNSNSNNDNDGIGNEEEGIAIVEQGDYGSAPSPVTVPEVWPEVPIVAINRHPLFPGFIKKVDIIKDEKLKELIRRKVKMRQPYVGVFVKKDDENKSESVASLDEIYSVGSFAHILEMRDLGTMIELILSAHRRIKIVEPISEAEEPVDPVTISRLNGRRTGQQKKQEAKTKQKKEVEKEEKQEKQEPKIILAKTENFSNNPVERTVEVKASMQAIIQAVRDIVQYSPIFGQQINLLIHPSQNVIENPVYLCDLVATLAQSTETHELQKMMEEETVQERLNYALLLLEKEKTVAKLKHEISRDVEKKVQDQHRKYLLNEQLKAIKKELGIEKDDKQSVIERMRDRLKNLTVPEHVMKVINEEEQKLNFLDPHSSEFSVSRNYLDWLTNIPWGKVSEENLDLETAKKILDEDHYGMRDVKDRILEFIAVGILKKKVGGKILCFHGPPGVGKTSIAKSIARALNREYFRFSVGGMTDVAEIKGHRRTYIGAMPGKVIQCLKKVQTENPLVLIDEVDKIGGAGYHGDPASALLELLDPEQNANFMDHFLDVPVDLSKILFICTANVIDTIPGPLKDRMELIEVSGYVAEEKLNIAEKYLIPQCRKDCALEADHLEIKEDALESLIKQYCRESGVRNLQKHIEKVFRKAAFQIAGRKEDSDDKIIVSNENLEKFVGRPKFTSDRMYDVTPPGVIMGLAWTAMGGSALYIEAALRKKLRKQPSPDVVPSATNAQQPPQFPDGSLEATGHLGDVMKESMKAAYTVAKNILAKKDPENDFLERAHIHVHVPEGAVPKDGPSAGCTITSALLSLAMDTPARQNIAMTGEISLTGKVLPVGGIKEKIIAAKRAGVNCVILPAENKKDVEDLPDFIKNDVEVHYAEHYDQVMEDELPESVKAALNDEEDVPKETPEEEDKESKESMLTEEEKAKILEECESFKKEGNTNFGNGRWKEAEDFYTKAIEHSLSSMKEQAAVYYSNRAAARIKLKLWEAAIEDCNKAEELGAPNEKPLERRAYARLHSGDDKLLDGALEDYKKLLEQKPNQKQYLEAVKDLEVKIAERNEKLKQEMFAQLKNLGNMCLRPFGLSTDNFQLVEQPGGGYSVNMKK